MNKNKDSERERKTIAIGNMIKTRDNTNSVTSEQGLNRAQTSIDLLLGVVIFFAAIGLLIGQNPALFFPGNVAASDTATTSDRIAQELVVNHLSVDGETRLNHEETVEFFESAEENPEFMENELSISENQGVKVELSFDSTNDERQVPLAIREDNDFEYDVETVGENDNVYRVSVESESFDDSGVTMTRAATLDDRRVVVSVTVGRYV